MKDKESLEEIPHVGIIDGTSKFSKAAKDFQRVLETFNNEIKNLEEKHSVKVGYVVKEGNLILTIGL